LQAGAAAFKAATRDSMQDAPSADEEASSRRTQGALQSVKHSRDDRRCDRTGNNWTVGGHL